MLTLELCFLEAKTYHCNYYLLKITANYIVKILSNNVTTKSSERYVSRKLCFLLTSMYSLRLLLLQMHIISPDEKIMLKAHHIAPILKSHFVCSREGLDWFEKVHQLMSSHMEKAAIISHPEKVAYISSLSLLWGWWDSGIGYPEWMSPPG